MISTENANKILKHLMKKNRFNSYEIVVKDNASCLTLFDNERNIIGDVYGFDYNDMRRYCLTLDNTDAKIEDFIEKMFELSRRGHEIYILHVFAYGVDTLLKPFETLEEVLVKADLEDDFS